MSEKRISDSSHRRLILILATIGALNLFGCQSDRLRANGVESQNHVVESGTLERIDRAVETCADIWDNRELRNKEAEFLVSVGEPAIPALISKLEQFNSESPDDFIALELLTETLQRIAGAPKTTIYRRPMEPVADVRRDAERFRSSWIEWWKTRQSLKRQTIREPITDAPNRQRGRQEKAGAENPLP